jgi:3'-5' exoribonuclease
MSPPQYVTRLPPGSPVSATMLVTAVESRSFGEGKDCVVLTLSDPAGRIDSAPFWPPRLPLLAQVCRGTVVALTGEVRSYRGRRQLEIAEIAPAADADPVAYLPSAGNPAPRWARLDGWRAEIRGPRLAAVVSLFYDDAEFRHRYGQCPASTAGHHASIGGLLQHTCEVAAIGQAMAAASGADRDLVLAGALLHDIGKVEAYRWNAGFETTDAGALLGHVALGLLMLSRRVGERAPPCTAGELLLLQHLIGSHHGRLEFGATTPPMTLEAQVLHHADDASAKSASMAQAVADAGHFEGEALLSSGGVWQLDRRRVYRGGSDWGTKKERPTSRG